MQMNLLKETVAGEAVYHVYSRKTDPPGFINHPVPAEVLSGQTSIYLRAAVQKGKLRIQTSLTGRTAAVQNPV